MKKISIVTLSVLFMLGNLFANSGNKNIKWEKELDEDGFVVYTRYSDYKFENGDEDTLFEWKLETDQEVKFDKVIAALENIENYKLLYDYCDEIKVLSEGENATLVYYYFDLPWPAGNIDLVREHTSNLDSTETVYTTHHICRPNKYPEQDAIRLKISDIHIKLIKLSDNKTRFECSSQYIPEGAPNFLAKGWLPDGPVEFIEKLTELSK